MLGWVLCVAISVVSPFCPAGSDDRGRGDWCNKDIVPQFVSDPEIRLVGWLLTPCKISIYFLTVLHLFNVLCWRTYQIKLKSFSVTMCCRYFFFNNKLHSSCFCHVSYLAGDHYLHFPVSFPLVIILILVTPFIFWVTFICLFFFSVYSSHAKPA